MEPAPALPTGPAATTTTEVTEPVRLPVVVDDCTAPQVGFAPLCETYGLIQEWHVDRPLDPGPMAAAALEGLRGFSSEETEPLPRTLFCALPDPAFAPLCGELADRMVATGVPVAAAMEAALLAMGDRGLDPFSYYLPPDQVGSFRANGVVEGVGILLDATDAAGSRCARLAPPCPLRIVFVLEDNPGAAAGLQPGDVVLAVDGETVDGRGFVETATRMGGEARGPVELTVEREGRLVVVVERGPIVVPTVEIDLPLPGVGYLRIPDFESDVPDLVRQGLSELVDVGARRLVLDLRDNPGGSIDAVVQVAGELMVGPLLEASARGETVVYEARGEASAADLELAVLVNGGTASAAEILAAALHDQREAVLIGEASFGKDVLQIPFELDNGGELHVAVARWRSPAGITVAGAGLLPDRATHLPADMSTDELASVAFE